LSRAPVQVERGRKEVSTEPAGRRARSGRPARRHLRRPRPLAGGRGGSTSQAPLATALNMDALRSVADFSAYPAMSNPPPSPVHPSASSRGGNQLHMIPTVITNDGRGERLRHLLANAQRRYRLCGGVLTTTLQAPSRRSSCSSSEALERIRSTSTAGAPHCSACLRRRAVRRRRWDAVHRWRRAEVTLLAGGDPGVRKRFTPNPHPSTVHRASGPGDGHPDPCLEILRQRGHGANLCETGRPLEDVERAMERDFF
jgi:hypothetical protein